MPTLTLENIDSVTNRLDLGLFGKQPVSTRRTKRMQKEKQRNRRSVIHRQDDTERGKIEKEKSSNGLD